MTRDDAPAPAWVTDRDADEGIPTVGQPHPLQDPPDLSFESQPWARYVGAGAWERLTTVTVHRARQRRRGYEPPGIPWLAIGIGTALAALLAAGLALLVGLASSMT